jgi:hypothetical protein
MKYALVSILCFSFGILLNPNFTPPGPQVIERATPVYMPIKSHSRYYGEQISAIAAAIPASALKVK